MVNIQGWRKLMSAIDGNLLWEKVGTNDRLIVYKEDRRWSPHFRVGNNWSVSLSNIQHIHKKENFVRYFKTKRQAVEFATNYMKRRKR